MATDPRRVPPTGDKSRGILFLVATPIGNLGDFSPRARDVLAAADLVLAEDTRHSAQLLRTFSIERPMLSLHEHNEAERVPEVLDRLARGECIALVSDAGTPLISDPGYRLVHAAANAGVRISTVPGACAAIAALSVSGLPTDRFCFEGFLPARTGARRQAIEALQDEERTLVFYEAPHRLPETLADLSEVLAAGREAIVARELTKAFESVYRGTLAHLASLARSDPHITRGEAVIVVAGDRRDRGSESEELDRVLMVLLAEVPVKQAAEIASKLTGAPRNTAYRRALELEKAGEPG